LEEHLKNKKYHNTLASLISYFTQEIENRILENIYKYCIDNKIIQNGLSSLCYDGIMIEKIYYKPELLNIFNSITFNKFGLDLKYEQKEMKHYLNVLNDHTTVVDRQIDDEDNRHNSIRSG
jgi:hypothetical protein